MKQLERIALAAILVNVAIINFQTGQQTPGATVSAVMTVLFGLYLAISSFFSEPPGSR